MTVVRGGAGIPCAESEKLAKTGENRGVLAIDLNDLRLILLEAVDPVVFFSLFVRWPCCLDIRAHGFARQRVDEFFVGGYGRPR